MWEFMVSRLETRHPESRCRQGPSGEGSVHAPLLGMWTASFFPSLHILCLRCFCVHVSPFYYARVLFYTRASLVAPLIKNLTVDTGETRDMGSIPGSGRSPREGNGNPLQYACLGNSMDRGRLYSMGLKRVGRD